MTDKKPPRPKVVQMPVGRVLGPMQESIRKLAVDTKNIYLSKHAQERMWERDISSMEVFEVLRLGSIDGLPWIEADGEDACKVVFKKKGARAIGVVTIILTDDGLLVKTVEWED